MSTYSYVDTIVASRHSGFKVTWPDAYGAAVALRKKSEPIVDEAMKLVVDLAGEEGARVLRERLAPVQTQWFGQLKQLSVNERRIGDEMISAARRSEVQKIVALSAALLCVVAGGIVFAVLLTRSVAAPLQHAVTLAERVADGDLAVEMIVTGKDESAEMLHALHTMVIRLGTTVQAVREATASISVASEDISRGNVDLSNRTERQAASIERTTALLTELIEAVGRNRDHAESARALAVRSANAAEEGSLTMRQVTGTMTLIAESSQRIAEIIGLIDGIAFQTNLLALNAAVEAAAAGERGRGFAVVANEVRELAQRSAAAAREVRELVRESTERVEAGSKQVAVLSVTMLDLLGCSRQVNGLIDAIATASGAQSESIGLVGDAMRDVDGTTTQNAALVEHVAAAAQSLVQQVLRLSSLVGQFRTEARSEVRRTANDIA